MAHEKRCPLRCRHQLCIGKRGCSTKEFFDTHFQIPPDFSAWRFYLLGSPSGYTRVFLVTACEFGSLCLFLYDLLAMRECSAEDKKQGCVCEHVRPDDGSVSVYSQLSAPCPRVEGSIMSRRLDHEWRRKELLLVYGRHGQLLFC